MAEAVKKSAISGEYIVSILESGTVKVHRIYDNTIGALREIAEANEFEYEEKWNTRTFGAKLIKALGEDREAHVGEYIVTRRENDSIEVYRYYDNTIGALREISEKIDFEYEEKWNTRTFGSKLVDYLNEQ